MSEMIERVARAICDASHDNPDPDWRAYEHLARAAIEAMREPTEAMSSAGARGRSALRRGRQL